MRIESTISNRYKSTIECSFAAAALITGSQEHRLSLWIECESNPPNSFVGVEAQLLHIRVLRSLERIDPGAFRGWSEYLDDTDMSQQLNSYLDRERLKLWLELRGELDRPNIHNYALRGICCQAH